MSNIEGGGYIIIGISEDKDGVAHKPEGMPEEMARSYDPDNVSNYINAFADPYVDIEVEHFDHGGNFFVVLKIHEFSTEPVICKKDANDIKRGTIYYRGHRLPQSSPIETSAEMREVIERAVDKAFKKQHKRSQSYSSPASDKFADEEREAYSHDAKAVMKEILERGYWEIKIKPVVYPGTPHSMSKLENVLRKCQVRYRGWYYPHVSNNEYSNISCINTGIESHVRWAEFAEVLRFHTSGQFVHYVGMTEDRIGDVLPPFVEWDPSRRSPLPGQPFLNPASALDYLTEMYLFASKIAQENIFGDEVVIEVTLYMQEGRILKQGGGATASGYGKCSIPKIKLGPYCSTAKELRSDHDNMAMRDAAIIFEKYNVVDDTLNKTLRGWQAEFYGRSP